MINQILSMYKKENPFSNIQVVDNLHLTIKSNVLGELLSRHSIKSQHFYHPSPAFFSSSRPHYSILSGMIENNMTQAQRGRKRRVMMDLKLMGFDSPLLSILHHLDGSDETDKSSSNAPTRTYFRDFKAMAATPADVKEYPNSYVFIVDMPGPKFGEIKVQVEDDNVLVVSGERKREEEKEGAKYVRMERRVGKFMRKFVLPENANTDKIPAVCQDGVLTVSVDKLPPPEPKRPKTVEVKVA